METFIAENEALAPVSGGISGFCEDKEGVLQANGEHSVFPYQGTGEVTGGDARLIEWAALQSMPEGDTAPLLGARFNSLREALDVQKEILDLAKDLKCEDQIELSQTPLPSTKSEHLPLTQPKSVHTTQTDHDSPKEKAISSQSQTMQNTLHTKSFETPKVFSSLFSLAKSVHSETAAKARTHKELQSQGHKEPKAAPLFTKSETPISENLHLKSDEHEQGEEQEQGQGQQDHNEQQQEKERPKQPFGFISKGGKKQKVSATIESEPKFCTYHKEERSGEANAQTAISSIGSLYFRFMGLMSRILGQAEAESHSLYQRIKDRTDQVDVLIKLQSKINNAKGAIDWTKDEEGQALLQSARAIGVDIPNDKLKWKVEEVPLLKENISMRKDSMEKITQLERTDMQRYLQEASQCHQARSNILKLMKEVGDTFVHNMRP
jgi:hypothetical protein